MNAHNAALGGTPQRLKRGIPLALRGVARRFGEREVLKDIDLLVPAGQFVAIVGRSGCGKSTLLRLLAGLDQPSRGELLAGSAALAEAREDTRLMFQDSRLLPWKRVIDNVGLGLRGDWRAKARQALRAVGLAERANEWPAALSGGQKQRVALARALIHEPRLLLLDEPLGALDALTRIEMQHLIEGLWREHGFTVLLVTHDVSEAVAVADRVILIEDGEIGLDLPVELPRPRSRGSARSTRWKPKCSTGCWRSRSCRRNPNPFHPCPRNCAGRSNQPCLVPNPPRRNAMTIKAINVRNQFKGTVKEIIEGPVLSEIDVQTAAGIVTSVITTRSVKELELAIGSEVIAFVKSTEVSIAKL